ncbi:MAG: SDR family oxidoreductase [Nannocystaceae bacterium]
MHTAADLAVVTGASAGIGRAIAERFVRSGHRVLSLARRPCPAEGVESVLVDLVADAGVAAAIAAVRERAPEPTRIHLVHNAAMLVDDSALALDPARFAATMRLNVQTPAELGAGLLPVMAPGSSIVFIGSTLSEQGVAGRLSYVASKHAVVGLLRATAQDLFGRGIHCACVCPGFTDTEMLRPLLDRDPAVAEMIRGMVSFGRLLDPAEIAEVVAFAAATPAMNGSILHATLGQRAT